MGELWKSICMAKKHAPFFPPLVWSAILLGILGGFGLGAHMVFVQAFGYPISPAFPAMIQVHGHLQLLGWTGLFIIAVSLYKLPRLMSARPNSPHLSLVLLVLVAGGVVVRSCAEIAIYYSPAVQLWRYGVCLGAIMESSGIFVYLFVIVRALIRFTPNPAAFAASGIVPFLVVSLVGWCVYAWINTAGALSFLYSPELLIDAHWTRLATGSYVYLILLPSCFAYSIGTFPIFLRLRAPNWPVKRVAMLYLLGASLQLSSSVLEGVDTDLFGRIASSSGILLRAAAVCWLCFELDLLRLRAPWVLKYRKKLNRENNPPRDRASDYGQFGNFEWLIYAAFGWLLLAVLAELIDAIGGSVSPTFVSASIIRHWYLLGFVTHLILGMAVRLIPGFLGSSRIAYPALVRLSFVLILTATIGRTLPLLFSLLEFQVFRGLYGFSGVLAMLALCCLGINLFATVRRTEVS